MALHEILESLSPKERERFHKIRHRPNSEMLEVLAPHLADYIHSLADATHTSIHPKVKEVRNNPLYYSFTHESFSDVIRDPAEIYLAGLQVPVIGAGENLFVFPLSMLIETFAMKVKRNKVDSALSALIKHMLMEEMQILLYSAGGLSKSGDAGRFKRAYIMPVVEAQQELLQHDKTLYVIPGIGRREIVGDFTAYRDRPSHWDDVRRLWANILEGKVGRKGDAFVYLLEPQSVREEVEAGNGMRNSKIVERVVEKSFNAVLDNLPLLCTDLTAYAVDGLLKSGKKGICLSDIYEEADRVLSQFRPGDPRVLPNMGEKTGKAAVYRALDLFVEQKRTRYLDLRVMDYYTGITIKNPRAFGMYVKRGGQVIGRNAARMAKNA
jgi:hypothetical protein